MSDKKHKKTIEELCRSRVPRTACGDMWPLSKTSSSNRILRSPSPRESHSRGRQRREAPRHPLFTSRPLSSDLNTDLILRQSAQETAAEKRKVYQGIQETVKKPFFPGISTQVVTHADPPFPATDTQPLPPINMPKGQDWGLGTSRLGKDNRPFTIYGQMPFESHLAFDTAFGEERASKRKLDAIKRTEEQERMRTGGVSRHYRQSEFNRKKKCWGPKKGRKGRTFSKPLAWKSPWPDEELADSDMETDWTDIN